MTAPAVVVVSPDELREIVRDAVRAALAERTPTAAEPSALLDLAALARLLACSTATVRRLMAEGAPVTHVGSSPRFDAAAVRSWLDARGRRASKAAPSKSSGPIGGMRLLSRPR